MSSFGGRIEGKVGRQISNHLKSWWKDTPSSRRLITSPQTLHPKFQAIINKQRLNIQRAWTFTFFFSYSESLTAPTFESPPWSLAGWIIMDVWLSSVSSGERSAVANRRADIKVNATDALGFSHNWARWDKAVPEFTLNQCLHTDTPETISLVPPASERSVH